MNDPRIGQDEGGYRLMERLATGESSVIYRANETSTDQDVALKLYHRDLLPENWQPALAELTGWKHQAAIIRAAGKTSRNEFFLAMDLLRGDSLAARLKKGQPLTLAEACSLMIEVVDAIALLAAKNAFYHDMRPSKLLISKSGLKLAAPGLCPAPAVEAALPNLGLEQTRHLAPETLAGMQPDELSIVFALGATLHSLLTNQALYPGNSAQEVLAARRDETHAKLAAGLGEHARQFLAHALATNRDSRYASLADFKQDLIALRDGGPIRELAHKAKAEENAAPKTSVRVVVYGAPQRSHIRRQFNPVLRFLSGCMALLVITGTLVGVLIMLEMVRDTPEIDHMTRRFSAVVSPGDAELYLDNARIKPLNASGTYLFSLPDYASHTITVMRAGYATSISEVCSQRNNDAVALRLPRIELEPLPDTAAAIKQLPEAELLIKKGKKDEAKAICESLLKLAPAHPEALRVLKLIQPAEPAKQPKK